MASARPVDAAEATAIATSGNANSLTMVVAKAMQEERIERTLNSLPVPTKPITFNAGKTAFEVCPDCNKLLIQAFRHCLMKNSSAMPLAKQRIEDALSLTGRSSPPAAEIIHIPQPSDPAHPIHSEIIEANVKKDLMSGALIPPSNAGVSVVNIGGPSPSPPKSTAPATKSKRNNGSLKVPKFRQTSDASDNRNRTDISDDEEENNGGGGGGYNEDDEVESITEGDTIPRFPSSSSHANNRLALQVVAQKQEIIRLKEQLVAKSLANQQEHEISKRMRNSMLRALEFSNKAGEWQDKETGHYKVIINEMQAEISALMAHMIVGEQERIMATQEYEKLRKEKEELNKKGFEQERTIDKLKDKLHEAFSDYLEMNKQLEKLTVEVEHGSETSRKRNELLQRNLESITRQYDAINASLSKTQQRNKNLEFELTEMVAQFKRFAAEKRSAEEQTNKLRTELASSSRNISDLETTIKSNLAQREKLEKELFEVTRLHQDTKAELSQRVNLISNNFEKLNDEKKAVERQFSELKIEHSMLQVEHNSLVSEKKDLDREYAVLSDKFRQETDNSDRLASDLRTQLFEEKARSLRTNEAKQNLLLEVNDLKNRLDAQNEVNSSLNEQINTLNLQLEETIESFRDQMDRLEASKLALVGEKKLLHETLKSTKASLKLKEDECLNFQAGLREANAKSKEENEEWAKKYQERCDLLGEAEREKTKLLSIQRELTKQLQNLRLAAAKAQTDIDKLRSEILEREKVLSEKEQQIEGVIAKSEEMEKLATEKTAECLVLRRTIGTLEERLRISEDNYNRNDQEKTLKIQELRSQIEDLKVKLTKSTKIRHEVITSCFRLIYALRNANSAVKREANLKEEQRIQAEYYRDLIKHDRELRFQSEMWKGRIDREITGRRNELVEIINNRMAKLELVERYMKVEYDQLRNVWNALSVRVNLE